MYKNGPPKTPRCAPKAQPALSCQKSPVSLHLTLGLQNTLKSSAQNGIYPLPGSTIKRLSLKIQNLVIRLSQAPPAKMADQWLTDRRGHKGPSGTLQNLPVKMCDAEASLTLQPARCGPWTESGPALQACALAAALPSSLAACETPQHDPSQEVPAPAHFTVRLPMIPSHACSYTLCEMLNQATHKAQPVHVLFKFGGSGCE